MAGTNSKQSHEAVCEGKNRLPLPFMPRSGLVRRELAGEPLLPG